MLVDELHISAIQREIEYINEHQKEKLLGRIIRATQDEEDLIKCYRRIQGHFRQLQVSTSSDH
jgi:hypothetical protein